MHDSTLLTEAAEKKERIAAWMKTAISKATAETRGLVQLSKQTAIRNWTCREALYDLAQRTVGIETVPVMLDYRRAALYRLPPKQVERPNILYRRL